MRAAIDIGSNSILLTVVDAEGSVVHDEARVVGLGRGLGDRGLLAPDRIAAAEAVLEEYAQRASELGVPPYQIKTVMTSAGRRAMNATTWLGRVQRKLGIRARVVTGDEEARLTWIGASQGLDLPDGPIMVVDLGGGSTEMVLGRGANVTHRASLELGSVRLTEAFLGRGDPVDPSGLAQLRNHVDTELRNVVLDPRPKAVVGVAGTVTTLMATHLGLDRYDSQAVHGQSLTRAVLARFIDRLLPADRAQRRAMVPSAPDRADYLLAGATILDRMLALARRQQLITSDRGVRFGLLQR
jgi:exopolyphosphatase / guanosine-5'-triphosphate,3'-diphosphate pyrophosphatase